MDGVEVSIPAVLGSFYFSIYAYRKAIEHTGEKIEQGQIGDIYNNAPGGVYSGETSVPNAVGGFLFLVGVLSLIYFVYQNV